MDRLEDWKFYGLDIIISQCVILTRLFLSFFSGFFVLSL